MKINKFGVMFLAILIFGFGVYFSSLRQDSKSLKQINKLNNETKQHQLTINTKSQELETKLQQVKAYEIQNHKKTATISHAVNTHCISPDFVKLFNQQTADYEKILSTKYINEMR